MRDQPKPDWSTIESAVLEVLDESLGLNGRTAGFDSETPLLGALPELDSMAVAWLIQGLEERFGIQIPDECVDADAFVNVRALTTRVYDSLPPLHN